MVKQAIGDPTVTWLLEPSNPSARYLTLTRVLGRREDDPAVQASRAAIPRVSPARDILIAQYPQGYWMCPGIGRSPRYRATVWQILILAQLGMGRCDVLDRAVDHLVGRGQDADGGFRARKDADRASLGLNGSLVWALQTLGYGDAAPVREARSWLMREVEAMMEQGSRRSVDDVRRSAWIKVLWAATAFTEPRREGDLRTVIRIAAESLLEPPCDPGRGARGWSQLTFPLTEGADLLQWVEVLTAAGYRGDARVRDARRRIRRKRRPDGAWPLERVPGKLWADFGEVKEANKWITVRALASGL